MRCLLFAAFLVYSTHAGGWIAHVETHNTTSIDPSAVCLDGSPGIFWLHRGNTTSNWVIAFEGGGWCYTPEDCWQRSQTELGTSKTMTSKQEGKGMFSGTFNPDCKKNPTFCEFNIAHLHYCDGDSFSGDREQPLNVNGDPIFFRGHRILKAALKKLFGELGLAQAQQVLLSGCSAGGLSTLLHADFIHEQLKLSAPSLKTFKALPLSSIFPVTIPNIAGQNVFASQMQAVFDLHNASGGVHQGCIRSTTPLADRWKCNAGQYVYPHVTSPVFLVQSVYDAWGTSCIFGGGAVSNTSTTNGNCSVYPDWQKCLGANTNINAIPSLGVFGMMVDEPKKCSASQVHTLNTKWRSGVLDIMQSAPTFTKAGNGAFVDTCHVHCGSMLDGTLPGLVAPDTFHNVKIDAVSMQSSIVKWWAAGPAAPAATSTYLPCTWFENSTTHQCNPTCGSY